MKTIPATKGYSAIVDDEDYEHVAQFRWLARQHPGGHRPTRAVGPVVIPLANDIMSPPVGMVVDHINGDMWDNRRENLRVCTRRQNAKNVHRKRAPGRFKGVSPVRDRHLAQISSDRQAYYLGYFDTAIAAALAYDSAAIALHGEFACLNFPDAPTLPRLPRPIGEPRPTRPYRTPRYHEVAHAPSPSVASQHAGAI